MTFPRLALVLVVLVICGEAGLLLWRRLPIERSTAPVFSFPPAAANFGTSPNLASAIQVYGADRGAEWRSTAADGTRLTVFYFEWDRVEAGPVMSMAGHSPDECNVAAGYTLQEVLTSRVYGVPGQAALVFDATHFKAPSGRSVHMFKMPWIQGLGARKLREGAERAQRLQNAFLRHQGAARVLQAGVFDARDADHAWQTFSTQVLDQLKW